MARTQFTFTFTNAQPGADVGFNFPAFADSSTTVQDGPTVVLDSTKSVSVWADAAYLIAHTVDGRGVQILGVATSAYPTQTIDAGVPGPNPFPSGGSTPVSKVLAIRYGTATALTAGVRQYLDHTFFATLDAQEVVGTDLSIQGDGSIVTAAGGQFLISLWCDFAVSGLAANEEVNVRISIPSSGLDSGADAFWNVNLPAGTAWAAVPAQAQARCGPCTFPPGGIFYGWVTLGPLSQGSVTLQDAELMVTRIG